MLDTLIQFFTQWGYLGLFLGSFLAGSIVPFSSEALVIACVGPLHMDPVTSLFVALAGNVSGGMTCYYIGHLGKIEWIEKYAHVSEEKLVTQFKQRPRLYWIGIGKDDFLYKDNTAFRELLDKKRLRYTYHESGAGHEWANWRDYLIIFTPQLFK